MTKKYQIPVPEISPVLTVEERAILIEGEQNPDDYAALIAEAQYLPDCPALFQAPDGTKLVALKVVVAIPHSLLPMNFGSVLNPHTKQPMPDPLALRTLTARPAPRLRVILLREALAEDAQRRLRAPTSVRIEDLLNQEDLPNKG